MPRVENERVTGAGGGFVPSLEAGGVRLRPAPRLNTLPLLSAPSRLSPPPRRLVVDLSRNAAVLLSYLESAQLATKNGRRSPIDPTHFAFRRLDWVRSVVRVRSGVALFDGRISSKVFASRGSRSTCSRTSKRGPTVSLGGIAFAAGPGHWEFRK